MAFLHNHDPPGDGVHSPHASLWRLWPQHLPSLRSTCTDGHTKPQQGNFLHEERATHKRPLYLLMLVWKPSTLVFTAAIRSKIFSCGLRIKSSAHSIMSVCRERRFVQREEKLACMATPKSFPSSIFGMRCWIQQDTCRSSNPRLQIDGRLQRP